MIRREPPAGAILGRFKPMSSHQMPSQHLAAKTTIETDHEIALHRAPDRNRRDKDFDGRRFVSEAGQGKMHP